MSDEQKKVIKKFRLSVQKMMGVKKILEVKNF